MKRLDYQKLFANSISEIKAEGRYREFKSLLRDCGNFPKAFQFSEVKADDTFKANIHDSNYESKPITLWCSNDYLG
jgi:5-aminolevulinate synthase